MTLRRTRWATSTTSAMTAAAVWKISVATTPEAEEAVSELLSDHFQAPASSYTSLERPGTVVSVYLAKKPANLAATRTTLRRQLNRLRHCGLRPGSCALSATRVTKWAESWKHHFKPIDAGPVLVRPGWSRRRPRPGQVEVVLDPGLAFGTGQHPTTAFCLRQLALSRRRKRPQSLLDLGTGSGILAIAAARLGYAPVLGLDFDPAAIRIARANARRNKVNAKLRLAKSDVRRLNRRPRRRFDLICANLLADLLLEQCDRILAQLKPGGLLLLAGILKMEFHKVQSAYEAAGMVLVTRRVEREWCSASFTWDTPN
ncbi:MAG TPA: 50S ribosomal protein L11 methyltransferase [Methylomirabilota bacterium]|nr:50S ribosomal protein L11 methyltransferase [Methylomirabilota bacterium]